MDFAVIPVNLFPDENHINDVPPSMSAERCINIFDKCKALLKVFIPDIYADMKVSQGSTIYLLLTKNTNK
jgi:hypothetical protein